MCVDGQESCSKWGGILRGCILGVVAVRIQLALRRFCNAYSAQA